MAQFNLTLEPLTRSSTVKNKSVTQLNLERSSDAAAGVISVAVAAAAPTVQDSAHRRCKARQITGIGQEADSLIDVWIACIAPLPVFRKVVNVAVGYSAR